MDEIKYRELRDLKLLDNDSCDVLPINWDVKALKFISIVNNGATPKTSVVEYWDGEINWYTPTDFGETNLFESNRKITVKGLNSCGTTLIPKNTCIITCRAPIGNIAISKNNKSTHNQGCKSIIARKMEYKYIYYYLIAQKEYISHLGKGTTFMELSTNDLKNLKLPYPNKMEQQKIANFLDIKTAQFDNIISKKEQLIHKLEEAKKSLISEVVTGKVKIVDGKLIERDPSELKDSGVEWLGMVPKNWSLKAFKYCFKVRNGKEIANELDIKEEAIPVYGSGGVFKYTDKYLYNGESILFGRKGTIGKPLFVNEEFWTVDTMYYTTFPENGTAKYFYYQLTCYPWENITTSTALPSVVGTDVENSLTIVPTLLEMKSLSKYLDNKVEEIDKLILQVKSQIQKLKQAKQSLISEAVTGKIDLRDWEIIEKGVLK